MVPNPQGVSHMSRFTGTNGAAERLDVSPPTVVRLADTGVLPCFKTESGRRVFEVAAVERLAAERRAAESGKARSR
jgi:DNA-binding transcriptional MerR regulator